MQSQGQRRNDRGGIDRVTVRDGRCADADFDGAGRGIYELNSLYAVEGIQMPVDARIHSEAIGRNGHLRSDVGVRTSLALQRHTAC